MLISSCVSKLEINNTPPAWFLTAPSDTPTTLTFRSSTTEKDLSLAKESAIEKITETILLRMNIGNPDRWQRGGRIAVNSFIADLRDTIRSPEYYMMKGLAIRSVAAWEVESGISYAIEITWEREDFLWQVEKLSELTDASNSLYEELEKRAQKAKTDGNIYEAALLWGTLAGIAEDAENFADVRRSWQEILQIIENDMQYRLFSAPQEISVNTQAAEPFVFQVTFNEKPVVNAEFLLDYPQNNQNGTLSQVERRLLTDESGKINFTPPAISSSGTQSISLRVSPSPFLNYLDKTDSEEVRNLVKSLNQPRITALYESQIQYRTIPTGVFVLEKDLAGNPLKSISCTGGIMDDLSADGFDINPISLDPQEMLSLNNQAFLNDLKADPRVSKRFKRVIHGTITLDSFEQDGDTFTVKVIGTLFLSDIQNQTAIYKSMITKTSRAGDGQQAMSAAFRQLGRSFAAELIARTQK